MGGGRLSIEYFIGNCYCKFIIDNMKVYVDNYFKSNFSKWYIF